MPYARRPALKPPTAERQMIDDSSGDSAPVVLVERTPNAANEDRGNA
jgi:hypothetical protein